LWVSDVYAQKKNSFSIETNLNYLHFNYKVKNAKNYFNYEASFLASYYKTEKLKLGIGILYASKYFYATYNIPDPLYKKEYRMQFIGIPFFIQRQVYQYNKQLYLNALFGFVIYNCINYDLKSYYTNKPTLYANNLCMTNYIDLSIRTGIAITIRLNERFLLNTKPFIALELLKENYNHAYPDAKTISFGGEIGIEFLLNK
jgi:hypothetical protein